MKPRKPKLSPVQRQLQKVVKEVPREVLEGYILRHAAMFPEFAAGQLEEARAQLELSDAHKAWERAQSRSRRAFDRFLKFRDGSLEAYVQAKKASDRAHAAEEAAWAKYHALLCPGPTATPSAADAETEGR